MVFLHHAFHVPLMWSGVDLFFILSGYLITGILLKDVDRLSFPALLKKFYVRRAERILPAYLVFLAIALFFTASSLGHLWPYYAFFLQNVPYAFHMQAPDALTPLWSLAVEQHFYLFWPAIIFFVPRRALAPLMIGILCLEPVLRAFCTPLFAGADPIYVLTPFRLDAMAAGALAALLLPRCRRPQTIRWAQAAMALGILSYILLAPHPWFRRSANTIPFNSLAYSLNILILGGLFTWVVLSENTWLTRLLSNPLLRGLGRISYMFYLLHLLILDQTSTHIPGRTSAAAVAFVITTGMAALSWFLIEKPVLSLNTARP
jgi:peptidoglycan/LPS O-acetylase OafA/YrhL